MLKFTAEWENTVFDHYIKELDDRVAAQVSHELGVVPLALRGDAYALWPLAGRMWPIIDTSRDMPKPGARPLIPSMRLSPKKQVLRAGLSSRTGALEECSRI